MTIGIERDFISEFEGWDEFSDFGLIFYNCVASRDFGPYNTGDKIPSLALCMESSKIESYDDEGKPVFTCGLTLVLDRSK